ncbi:hypothetical protein [Gordonia sp. NPDC127522]|uniref:hypothetical protein n=1 Tax=Gordonia sp. NPDC127522 TaxID=3345390 RepID=UPI003642698C
MSTGREVTCTDVSRCGPWEGVSGVDVLVATLRRPDSPSAGFWPMGEGMWLTEVDHGGITLARNKISAWMGPPRCSS